MSGLSDEEDLQTLQGLKILLVDDNLDNRDIISYALQSAGAEVVTLTCAVNALKMLEQFQPQVLISNIAMPLVDGYSLINSVRQGSTAYQDILAIAITALNEEEVLERACQSGFDACLLIPFNLEALIELVIRLTSKDKGGADLRGQGQI